MHIATDGETYGHHHNHGDMALAYALHHIERRSWRSSPTTASTSRINPPTHEVEILENTAWSCSHGVDRWSINCGCNSGGNPGWNQAWRAPLREALDWLRDSLVAPYETKAAEFLTDPWLARDDYIDMVLDRSEASLEQFLAHAHAAVR